MDKGSEGCVLILQKGFLQKYQEQLLYLFFGGCTTAVNYVCYVLFRGIGLHYAIATVLSWISAVLFAYETNSRFVFRARTEGKKQRGIQFASFLTCRILSLGVELGLMVLLVDWIKVNDYIAKALIQVAVIVFNYVGSKWFVFRKKEQE